MVESRAFIVSKNWLCVPTRYVRVSSAGAFSTGAGVSFCVPAQQPQVSVEQPQECVFMCRSLSATADDDLELAVFGKIWIVIELCDFVRRERQHARFNLAI